MNSKYILAVVTVLVVAGASAYAYVSRDGIHTDEQIMCTAEAKQCPDGSYVGRTGPNCEFAACPGEPVGHDDGSMHMIIDDGRPAITKEGRVVCLPHKNTEGPQTMECAFGLKAKDGKYYALDGGDMPDEVTMAPMDRDVRIEGRFTPLMALSTDFWQKYPIEGIITVTALIEI